MNIGELLNVLDYTIDESEEHFNNAAIRSFTIYKDVVMYLIVNGKIDISDNKSAFDSYTETYTISALYRVAEHYRKTKGFPALNYQQPIYFNHENTITEFKERLT